MSTTTPERIQAPTPQDPDLRRQMEQAEELLFSEEPKAGFVKGLFAGKFRAQSVFPYPTLPEGRKKAADDAVAAVREYAETSIDAAEIDRAAEIPDEVVEGLGRLGVLGMTAPKEYGGRGFSQSQYCRVMEVVGGHDASVGVFVNAHHSIGIRALLLFGTEAQKAEWLPPLVNGEKLAAFALTEEQAGSDASNVQTVATPSEDGQTYVLNGTKRWITNGGIADVLTVMARTPDPKGGESKITAFLVTPDMPGFEVIEARMAKTGIRGTATGKLAFHDMPVPAANVLGPIGKGLRVALTVLDFGRTTFGASCTGIAKTCIEAAVPHANSRRQFGKSLGHFELVKKKIARMAALTYAMEATTYETAALIDSGAEDYMLETAILKIYATEALWEIVYETMQIYGGACYFLDKPFERWMRDARINQIGEGANEVLKAFVAVVGMRDVGMGLLAVKQGIGQVSKFAPTLGKFVREHAGRLVAPAIPVKSESLRPQARALGRRVKSFGWAVESTLIANRKDPEGFLEREYVQERIADAVIALTTSACALARLDHQLSTGTAGPSDREAAELYLQIAGRRFDGAIRELKSNDDPLTTRAADAVLKGRRSDA